MLMHFMLGNRLIAKVFGSCYVLDSSTGYDGQPPTCSTTLLGGERTSYKILPFSFNSTKTEELLGWAARAGQGVTTCPCSTVHQRAAAVLSSLCGHCVTALLQESTQICQRFLISVGETHRGKGMFRRECHQQLTCCTSALCRRARHYPQEHLHGMKPGGTLHLMRILFILRGATNLSSEHFVLIKN